VKALLIGLLALACGQSMPGISKETLALLDRSPAVASPLTGYLEIGAFFLRSGQLERAKQIYAYGLLYAPSDPRFLSALAVVEDRLGHREFAREYALATLAYEPGNTDAQQVLLRVGPAPPPPSPAASPSPAPSPEASAAPPSPAPEASKTAIESLSPWVRAGINVILVSIIPDPLWRGLLGLARLFRPAALKSPEGYSMQELATAVGAKGPDDLKGLNVPPRLDPEVKGDKLHALGVLKAVDAALKIYKLNHPKEEIKELDLKKLVGDKALPKELDLSVYPTMTLAEGKLSMNGFGAMDALEKDLTAYREGLEKAARHREKGLLSEAHSTLAEMEGKFPGDPELLERLLRVQLELNLDFPGAESARKLYLARPGDPRHLWTLAVLFFRSRRPERARVVALLLPKVYQDSYYTPAAKAMVALVDSGVSPEQIQKMIEERTAAPPSPDPSPSPEASPSPSPAPSPSPSPK
jgi:hypothetical protein